MTIVAQLTTLAGNLNGVTRTNTASFASQTAATGGVSLPDRTASATVGIVEPSVSLTKTNNSGGPAVGGQTITYTLKPANGAGRPALHDAWQLDCLPAGMTFAGVRHAARRGDHLAPVAGAGTNGCPAGYTVLAWNLGDLAGGSTLTLTYTATVDPTASGKTSLVNLAGVSGNSLAGARTSPVDPGNPAGRQYSGSASSTITIAGASAAKSVSPTSATVGGTVTYTTSAAAAARGELLQPVADRPVAERDRPELGGAGHGQLHVRRHHRLQPEHRHRADLIAGPRLVHRDRLAARRRDHRGAVPDRDRALHRQGRRPAAAVAGAALTNQLHVAWDQTASSAPTSAGASYDQASRR